jgi:plasmid stability protein
MSQITIRKLDPEVKARIRSIARVSGRTMEGQIRVLLTETVGLGVIAETKISTRDNILGMLKEHQEVMQASRLRRERNLEAKKSHSNPL